MPNLAALAVLALALCPTAPQEPAPGQGGPPAPPAAAAPKRLLPVVETVTRAGKGVELTADYTKARGVLGGPTVVCLHDAAGSRGEFKKIAAEFIQYGCPALAVDLRVGKEADGVANATAAAFEKAAGKPATLTEALDDVATAVEWAKELRPDAKVLLLGSGTGATLALAFAARNPAAVDGVLAYSPTECLEGVTVAAEMRQIKVPVHMGCGSGLEEKSKTTRFFNALDKKLRSSYFPAEELQFPPGASQLAHEDESLRNRAWHGVHKIREALSAAAAPPADAK
jgi:dienelactone hydrolase